MDREKFDAIFRDATVIDVDLSQWDSRIRLVIVALEEKEAPEGSRLPIYAVDFIQASELHCRFRHWDISEKFSPEGHFQWNVYEVSVSGEADSYVISLSSSPQLPMMTIRCKDVEISPIAHSVLDMVNPGWNKPRQPLARPGILELAEKRRRDPRS
jgi:hypothetical protein